MLRITPFGRLEIPLDALPDALEGFGDAAPTPKRSFARELEERHRLGEDESSEAAAFPQPAGPAPSPGAPERRRPDRADSAGGKPAGNSPPAAPARRTTGVEGRTEAAGGDEPTRSDAPLRQPPSPDRRPAGRTGLRSTAVKPQPPAAPTVRAGLAPGRTRVPSPGARTAAAKPAVIGRTRRTPRTATSRPKPPARRAAPLPRWAAEHRDSVIRRIALAVTKEGGAMRLLLDPPELGRVDLALVLRGDRLALRIETERPEAAGLLRREEAALTAALEARGLTLAGVEIESGGPDTGAWRDAPAGREGTGTASSRFGRTDSSQRADSGQTPVEGTSRLDSSGLDLIL